MIDEPRCEKDFLQYGRTARAQIRLRLRKRIYHALFASDNDWTVRKSLRGLRMS